MRRVIALIGSGFAALAVYAGNNYTTAQNTLKHQPQETYAATITALDDAAKALDYIPEQDRTITMFGEQVPFTVTEKLPDLARARTSIENAITHAPVPEKPALKALEQHLDGPGLHQEEKQAIVAFKESYFKKESAADLAAYRLQQTRQNNGLAAIFFSSAALICAAAYALSRKK